MAFGTLNRLLITRHQMAARSVVYRLKKNLFKQVMDEQRNGQMKSLQHRIDQFLFNYRNTPTGVTEDTPAQLFLSWKPRTRLSLLHPDIEQRMKEKLERTKQSANQRRGAWRDFEEGEGVLVQGLRPGEGEWLSGKVNKRVSSSTYVVGIGNEERYVHVDNLRPRTFQECFPQSVHAPSPNLEPPACSQDIVSRRSQGAHPVNDSGARETVHAPSPNTEPPAGSQDIVSRRSLGAHPVNDDGERKAPDTGQVGEQAVAANKEHATPPDPSSAGREFSGSASPSSQPELRRSTRQRRPLDRY